MDSQMHLRQALYVLPVFLILAACQKAPAPNVAATVNGRPITYDDIDRIYQSQLSTPGERPGTGSDLVEIQKLEILRSLVEREIMVQRAEKLGLLATDSEVDAKFNDLKAPYTQEEFQKQLDLRKMTASELKAQLRRDLSYEKLINKEVASKISITDKEIGDFFAANKASFNHPEPTLHLAQILVTSTPDATVRNLKNDKAQTDDQARKKIQAIATRLKQGEDFAMLAENYSEDSNSASNGGDLGFLPVSAFEGSSAEVKKLISSLQPGQISPVIPSQGSYRILKLMSREPAGQRELNDPRVQQTIRQELLGRKEQLLRNAYIENARNEAKVVDYFALRVLETKGK
jgi:peptidyl-prolyl cis-trans isomerase SurA